ncbi:hypothetical protein SEA_GODONK_22 [Gordonia phage GodonK]|uniref:Uncharacterized protein n=1 Tax=Gordonia phage GodonK TaxID=2562192 RepID=A0A4D6E298_9CAUD|nr:hypothetical protein HOV33_gp022 [Gordonia phage GodonK]QBZ72641.1 hypothetical protein SEA_GODONK_22 [Gordonia phage GodonK]
MIRTTPECVTTMHVISKHKGIGRDPRDPYKEPTDSDARTDRTTTLQSRCTCGWMSKRFYLFPLADRYAKEHIKCQLAGKPDVGI